MGVGGGKGKTEAELLLHLLEKVRGIAFRGGKHASPGPGPGRRQSIG